MTPQGCLRAVVALVVGVSGLVLAVVAGIAVSGWHCDFFLAGCNTPRRGLGWLVGLAIVVGAVALVVRILAGSERAPVVRVADFGLSVQDEAARVATAVERAGWELVWLQRLPDRVSFRARPPSGGGWRRVEVFRRPEDGRVVSSVTAGRPGRGPGSADGV